MRRTFKKIYTFVFHLLLLFHDPSDSFGGTPPLGWELLDLNMQLYKKKLKLAPPRPATTVKRCLHIDESICI